MSALESPQTTVSSLNFAWYLDRLPIFTFGNSHSSLRYWASKRLASFSSWWDKSLSKSVSWNHES